MPRAHAEANLSAWRRALSISLAVLALAILSAACGGDDDETTEAGVTTFTTTVEVTTTDPAATTAPTTTTTPEPPGPFSTAPAQGAALSSRLALLTDVRLGRHVGYDRIVFEFLPGGRPGYRVRFVRPPIVEDASGTKSRSTARPSSPSAWSLPRASTSSGTSGRSTPGRRGSTGRARTPT